MQPTLAGGVPVQPGPLDVAAKTQKVVDYTNDPEQPGRPLTVMFAGAMIALICMILIGVLSYQGFYEHRVSQNSAYLGDSLLFCFYVLGVFLFSYGYELYDVAKALKMTIVVAIISAVFLYIVIVAFMTLSKVQSGASMAAKSQLVQSSPLARTAISYLVDDDAIAAEEAAQRERDGLNDLTSPDGPLLFITCQECHEKFMPVPPHAICPWCGKAALPG